MANRREIVAMSLRRAELVPRLSDGNTARISSWRSSPNLVSAQVPLSLPIAGALLSRGVTQLAHAPRPCPSTSPSGVCALRFWRDDHERSQAPTPRGREGRRPLKAHPSSFQYWAFPASRSRCSRDRFLLMTSSGGKRIVRFGWKADIRFAAYTFVSERAAQFLDVQAYTHISGASDVKAVFTDC